MNRQKIILYAGTALCVLSVVPFIISYGSLPEMLPCQFGLDQSVTNYMNKLLFMILTPCIFILVNIYLYRRDKDAQKINLWNIILPLLCAGAMVFTYIIGIQAR